MLQHLLGAIARLFFRRIAVVGAGHVPAHGPVLLVLNHPNALVDPLVLLVLSPRRIVFLAKEPLFRIPVIGAIAHRFGAIPVHRRQDHADMTRNRETFARVWRELAAGGAVAIFPEGASHSDPRLRPFKTGAARLALGAAALADSDEPVRIVPAGLYYTAKGRFRSSVLLSFGAPITVRPVPLEPDGEPPAEPVRQLTADLERAMAAVTLQADHHDAVRLIARAERIFSSADDGGHRPDLPDQFALRRRFLTGYADLQQRSPAAVEALEHRVARYEAGLSHAGIAPENVTAGPIEPVRAVRYTLRTIGWFAVAAPLALAGTVLHFPAYQLTALVARRFASRSPDVVATLKIVAAALCYPLTWVVAAVLVDRWTTWRWGLLTLLLAPVSGWAALRFLERLDRLAGATRALMLVIFRPGSYRRLLAERRRIRDEILSLAERLPGE
jgi:1-acyl-sn-glycerol-3-phosphate acyltransferase